MDIERFSDSETVSGIGHTIDRPFRVRSKSQGRSILLVDTKSKSMDDRSALSVPRQNMNAYAFSPIGLIPKVLQHMNKFSCQLFLIAPQWPRRHWYTDLLQMLVAPIRRLSNKITPYF